MGTSEASTRRRVKLYMLNDERQWDDKGTGHVSAVCTEQDNMALVVISETDGSYLLESKIQPDTAYQKQQETLIVWSEGDNMDLALSFQEKVGCEDVWEKICAVQGKDPSVDITQEVVDEPEYVDESDSYTPAILPDEPTLSLPSCEFAHLEEIAEVISQSLTSPPKRERLAGLLESSNYLNQLLDLFHKAEDLEDLKSLHLLYEIMRQLILLNNPSFYEVLFADDMIMDVIGVLEYSPSGRSKHREFLKTRANFKEVLPLHNIDLISKIHQTYRVQYIQECCLPPPFLFDEHTLSQLKSFVSLCKLKITRALHDDEEFMCRLFARLKSQDTELAHRRELSLFVKEFCTITMQTEQRDSFLGSLLQHDALRTAEVLLAIDDRDIKSGALEILQAFVDHQPSVVRSYVYRDTASYRSDDELLINLMITQLLNDSDPELSDGFLLGYMLKILIDPDNMNSPGVRSEKSEFLGFFYKRCISTLVRPLFDNTVDNIIKKDDYHTALVLNHILELSTFCIETHSFQMKNYCFNHDFLKRVLVLLQSSHKFLILAALRLLRRVIHMKEEFYNRYLIKNNLFRPVINLFVSNGHRYNLIDSAIIELFDYIRTESVTSLITHIVENFWDILKGVTYVQTFNDLKRTYDLRHRPARQTLVGAVGQQTTLDVLSLVNAAAPRFQRDPRDLDAEQQRWFDTDDDDEDEDEENQLFSAQSSMLVNGTPSTAAIPSLSVGPLSDGLSTVPHFDAQSADLPTIATTTVSGGILGLPSITNSPPSNFAPVCSTSVFPSSTATSPLLCKPDNLLPGPPLSSTTIVPFPSAVDRIHPRDSDSVDEFLTRPQLSRQTTPISIHIKSIIPSVPSDLSGTLCATTPSLGLDDTEMVEEEEETSSPPKLDQYPCNEMSNNSLLNSNTQSPQKRRSFLLNGELKSSKRPRSDDDDNNLSPDTAGDDRQSPPALDSDDDNLSIGLVDYSDEESGEEDESLSTTKELHVADTSTPHSSTDGCEVSSSSHPSAQPR